MANAINWFEIPASNFSRAVGFYSHIFGAEMQIQEMMGNQMAFFNATENGVSGAVIQGEGYEPSEKGTLPYLNGGENLEEVLQRVPTAGGKILMPKTRVSEEVGYVAFFMDTEGNRVALHSAG